MVAGGTAWQTSGRPAEGDANGAGTAVATDHRADVDQLDSSPGRSLGAAAHLQAALALVGVSHHDVGPPAPCRGGAAHLLDEAVECSRECAHPVERFDAALAHLEDRLDVEDRAHQCAGAADPAA